MTDVRARLLHGLAIPAHPLALTADRRLDERRQRALTRYYCAAGAGGVAVAVHTTQFAIRDPRVGLFAPVLELARETVEESARAQQRRIVTIAGVCGDTAQATREATRARDFGYDAALLSLAALTDASDAALVTHSRAISEILPIVGFYLQPAVGGRRLTYDFWRAFLEIEAVVAIKVAPFDRYATLDVARALAVSGRVRDVALYTGNDDNILADLLTDFHVGAAGDLSGQTAAGQTSVRFVGGLLGHWAVWTRRAVEQLEAVRACRAAGGANVASLLALGSQVTDANAVFFDARHRFAGCIAGLHEVLRRQGLLAGRWCLDPHEDLSPGQADEIDRVLAAYPHLADDDFVADQLDEWLR